ncbi:MAG: helix-turn-helix transcriptional regulator [Gammaproteobacteria bacterium]
MRTLRRRIIRLREVRDRTGLSESTIYRQEKAGKFPKRVQLGPQSIGWFEDEIDQYLENLARGFASAPQQALAARGLNDEMRPPTRAGAETVYHEQSPTRHADDGPTPQL